MRCVGRWLITTCVLLGCGVAGPRAAAGIVAARTNSVIADAAGASAPAGYGQMSVSPTALRFGGTKAGAAGALTLVTGAQAVSVSFSGTSGGWTAAADQPWLQLSNASGNGAGQFSVSIVNPGNVIGGSTALSGTIIVTPGTAGLPPMTVTVTLRLDLSNGSSLAASFGQVDTPAQNAKGVVASIGVTGWALDDVGVTGVKIYRNCLPFEPAVNCQQVSGANVVFLGDATFVSGARPDVEAAFPTAAQADRAGWGYLLLTTMLPDVTNGRMYGGQGLVTLYAFAGDVEGNTTLLGRTIVDHTPTRITMANASLGKPFGAIDTPAQGATVSGTVVNFGWVLTPDADTVAGNGDIQIPTDGSTVRVIIDGVTVGTVSYDLCRGNVGSPVPAGVYCNDDVASVFGARTPQASLTPRTSNPTKYRNLDAGRAAIGAFVLDTTTLSNGLHSIVWGVTDSAGRTDGIGSRYFTVQNSVAPCSGCASAVSYDAAVRFLEQSTFGPTPDLIAHVQRVGFEQFLEEQFATPSTPYPDVVSPAGTTPGTPLSAVQAQFFVNALRGEDQLRQRVAFALEQIFVISQVKNNRADQFVPWLRMMNDSAFGNFRTLMTDVTLSPAMGRYLDMVNNDKASASGSRTPNENYARELLQLFTIGVYELNDDGSKLLVNGQPLATYLQEDVEELARVFTGWTYPTAPGAAPLSHNPQYYYGPMVAVQNNHDVGSKTLMNAFVVPAGQTAQKDLADALDHIFRHPNVGPFISMRLIQHLVKSSPSPAYVWRVTQAFNDNGQGVRGDLRAVVRSILLDEEARAGDRGEPPTADAGHLREPVLYVTNLARAASATSDGSGLMNWSAAAGQRILSPLTVFNYYHPEYRLPDTDTLAPEFEIHTPATEIVRANFVYALTFGGIGGTTMDWTYWTTLAADTNRLLDALNHFLLHGQMPAAMRRTIATAVAAYPASQPRQRAMQAFYLVATSSQYQIAQ